MASKLTNWPRLLDAIIAERRDRQFEWGKQDCAMFAADVVLAITGMDYAKPFRGKYSTERRAYKILKKLTKADDWRDGLILWMDQTGMKQIKTSFAQRGDVVLVRTDRGPALAVVGSPGSTAFAAADAGLMEFHTSQAERAWRVGGAV